MLLINSRRQTSLAASTMVMLHATLHDCAALIKKGMLVLSREPQKTRVDRRACSHGACVSFPFHQILPPHSYSVKQ